MKKNRHGWPRGSGMQKRALAAVMAGMMTMSATGVMAAEIPPESEAIPLEETELLGTGETADTESEGSMDTADPAGPETQGITEEPVPDSGNSEQEEPETESVPESESESQEEPEETPLSTADIESIRAYTDATFYGTGVVEVIINYKPDTDLSEVTKESYVLEDRGSLSPDFGEVKIAEISVDGSQVTLIIDQNTAATENNRLIVSGPDREGSRERNAFGIYPTGAWYRDVNGTIYYGTGDEEKGYEANTTNMGYQARESLELRLRHATEETFADEAKLADEATGRYNASGLWLETVDLQLTTGGFQDLYDLQIPSTAANAGDGTSDAYVQGYYYIPDGYDPANGIIFTLQGQGISYWRLPDGTDDKGTGFMYDATATSWAENTGAIVVNIHDRSSASKDFGNWYEDYDFVVDDVNVMKYFIEEHDITGNIVLQGNSRGTMASDMVIKALAGQDYNPKNQQANTALEETSRLDKSVYDFEVDTFICNNGFFGYQYDESDWEAVAATGLKVWIFDGEQDTNNIEQFITYTDLMTEKMGADWAAENIRMTAYPSEIYYYWGESDHSTTRIQGWYFDDQVYYGPNVYVDENGDLVYTETLSPGDTYRLLGRGQDRGGISKADHEFVVYGDLYQDWAFESADAPVVDDSISAENVASIKASVTGNFYGYKVDQIVVTFKEGTDMSQISLDTLHVFDRGFSNPNFGEVEVIDVKVEGNTAILSVDQGTDKVTDRSRETYGTLCTSSAWYRDSAGVIHYGSEESTDALGITIQPNTISKGLQWRENLDLILCVNTEDVTEGIRSTDDKGQLLADSVWEELELGYDLDKVQLEMVDIGYEAADYTMISDKGEVPVFVIYPDNYDPNRSEPYPVIDYQCGGGVCYWEVTGSDTTADANNLGCNVVYDTTMTEWHKQMPDAIIMSVNVHSGTTENSAYEITKVFDYAIENWNVDKDRIMIVGNSQGTLISSDVIRQRPDLIAGFVEMNGDFGGRTNVADLDGTLENSSWGQWTLDEVNAIIDNEVAVWMFNGETDGGNPAAQQDIIEIIKNLYREEGKSERWIDEHVRASGLQSWKFKEWGETDHSVTKVVAWNYIANPYNDIAEDGTILNVGDTYKFAGQESSYAYYDYTLDYDYTVYAESVAEWAQLVFDTVNGGMRAVDFDSITNLEKDFSQAAQLPLTGYFTKTVGDGREVKVYIAEEASIRSYFTVVAVPDGVDTWTFLNEEGWIEMADTKGEGLFILEPGTGGWGSAQDEAAYLESATAFLRSGNNANAQNVFSTFGEFYLVGYGKGASALELWAAANPILVISQTYVDGKSAGNNALAAVSGTRYDGTSANGDITDELKETLEKVAISGEIAPKDVPVPTYLINYTGSEKHWRTANDCVSKSVGGVFYQSIDSDAYATDYANSLRKAAGEKYGLSQVKIARTAADAETIYTWMSAYTRYDTTFAYSNALADRLDYTTARVAAQKDAKDGEVKETLSDGTQIWAMEDVEINGHGTLQVGVMAFSDNSGDGQVDPREYMMYIPYGFEGNDLPVLMIYPGNTQTDSIFMDSTLWWQVADEEGIALVFICETYNASPSSISHADSDMFYNSLITLLEEKIDGEYADLDFTRVYGTGQSAGSMTTQGFAMSYPEFFAAVASTSAAVSPREEGDASNSIMLSPAVASGRQIPVMLITGHMDISDLALGFDSTSLQGWANYMLQVNGFDAAFTADSADKVFSASARHPEIYSWTKTVNGTEMPLVQWGIGLLRPHNLYPSEMPILWDFLKHYSFEKNADGTVTRYYSASAFEKNDKIDISSEADQKPITEETVKIALTNTTNGVQVTWDKIDGADGYLVYRMAANEKYYTIISDLKNGDATSYTDRTIKNGTRYTYAVRAYRNGERSKYERASIVAVKALKTPTVTVTNINSGVRVNWNKIANAQGYLVYRRVAGGNYTILSTILNGSTVSYTDKTAKSGTTYIYTVRAISGSVRSEYKTQTILHLSQPVLGISRSGSRVTVTWNKVAGAKGYYVYKMNSAGKWARIRTINSANTLNYTDTSGKKGGIYTVVAFNGSTRSSHTRITAK